MKQLFILALSAIALFASAQNKTTIDPSFTGESSGEPRSTASPDINTEDFLAAVSVYTHNVYATLTMVLTHATSENTTYRNTSSAPHSLQAMCSICNAKTVTTQLKPPITITLAYVWVLRISYLLSASLL